MAENEKYFACPMTGGDGENGPLRFSPGTQWYIGVDAGEDEDEVCLAIHSKEAVYGLIRALLKELEDQGDVFEPIELMLPRVFVASSDLMWLERLTPEEAEIVGHRVAERASHLGGS